MTTRWIIRSLDEMGNGLMQHLSRTSERQQFRLTVKVSDFRITQGWFELVGYSPLLRERRTRKHLGSRRGFSGHEGKENHHPGGNFFSSEKSVSVWTKNQTAVCEK